MLTELSKSSLQAAPGAKVTIKGSALLNKGWNPSSRGAGRGPAAVNAGGKAWEIDISDYLRSVYNPFAMMNAPGDRYG